jgi:hypothetical protein
MRAQRVGGVHAHRELVHHVVVVVLEQLHQRLDGAPVLQVALHLRALGVDGGDEDLAALRPLHDLLVLALEQREQAVLGRVASMNTPKLLSA